MALLREDVIHYQARQYLREHGWFLVAGQYPNGSDDDLPTLNVVDPILACDNSPDHRRHSKNKYVPDLVAVKNRSVLVIEFKPCYCPKDEEKLVSLLSGRRYDFIEALSELVSNHHIPLLVSAASFIPCLGFSMSSGFHRNANF